MGEAVEVPKGLLDELYARHDAKDGFSAGRILGPAASEEARKVDISDSYTRFREASRQILEEIGVVDPAVVDRVTMYVAVQERAGFESGVKFVHDNAYVSSRAEADRQRSVLHSMKTAGI